MSLDLRLKLALLYYFDAKVKKCWTNKLATSGSLFSFDNFPFLVFGLKFFCLVHQIISKKVLSVCPHPVRISFFERVQINSKLSEFFPSLWGQALQLSRTKTKWANTFSLLLIIFELASLRFEGKSFFQTKKKIYRMMQDIKLDNDDLIIFVWARIGNQYLFLKDLNNLAWIQYFFSIAKYMVLPYCSSAQEFDCNYFLQRGKLQDYMTRPAFSQI